YKYRHLHLLLKKLPYSTYLSYFTRTALALLLQRVHHCFIITCWKNLVLGHRLSSKTRSRVAKVRFDITKERSPHIWMGFDEETLLLTSIAFTANVKVTPGTKDVQQQKEWQTQERKNFRGYNQNTHKSNAAVQQNKVYKPISPNTQNGVEQQKSQE
ncbi:hypothetical protein H5410_026121, partial [Solanum commersonii]